MSRIIYEMKMSRILTIASMILLISFSTLHAAKSNRQKVEKDFRLWLEAFKVEARKAGISDKTIRQALHDIKLQWKLPDLEIPGKPKKKPKKTKTKKSGKVKRQPEFDSPGRYFPKNYMNILTANGRKFHKKWKKSLASIEKKYGVEAEIILSIWGRETAYGKSKLPHYAVEVLATQAFMGRRKEYFQKELMTALEILEQGHVKPKQMKSSWAGAMGYTQFMPDDFKRYAVDFNGDGKRDIWKNIQDALASTAHYLHKNGWEKGKTWGYEVRLPINFDCRHEGFDKGRTIAEWMKLGAKRVRKQSFSKEAQKQKAYLLIPTGIKGPAFLVTDNFLVLKTYNQANLYALFVGHIADRVTINKPFATKWPKRRAYARSHMREVQEKLAALGYEVGKIDGIIGPKSRAIIGDFQKQHKLSVSCYPNGKFFSHLTKKYKQKHASIQ